MKAKTVCLRCHQKCILVADVRDGKVVGIEDASINRKPACVEACPIGMDIPDYIMAVAEGKLKEAMEIIRDTNPFPGVLGRICHHPCELDCYRNAVDTPIAIQWIKRLVADYAMKTEGKPAPVERTQKEKIAIIGSGPAGLTAAHDLVKAGYGVTVFESAPIAGGMLATTIPEFKLPQAVVQAEVDYIKALGVEIKTNTEIGKNLTIDNLLKKYSAVLIATGSQKPSILKIPGSNLKGIYNALSFLQSIKQGKKMNLGDKVIVIGGGDTAMDTARVALRLGAKEVHLVCLECRRDMPAHKWEIQKAEREGVKFHPALAPQKFRSRNDHVAGIDFKEVNSTKLDKDGRITWTCSDTGCWMDADSVIVAIGQSPDFSSLGADGKIKLTPRGTIAVKSRSMTTDIPGIFAAGDVVVGAGTVVDGVAAGRRAAAHIIKYLTGSLPRKPKAKSKIGRKPGGRTDFVAEVPRQEMPCLTASETVKSFKEVELGLTKQMAMQEANRCIDCQTVCPKGLTIPDVMYHPDRLLYPLKRVGERGEGKWERISWEEALTTIAGKLKEIKDKYGGDAIHVSSGSGQKDIGCQATGIAQRLWPTPNTHRGRYTCAIPEAVAGGICCGGPITYEYAQDFEHSKCIVFWGSEPNVATPYQTRKVNRALRGGAKMIVVDPRPISMAKRADIWLRIRPGTDTALALAMAHVIINENLYDKEFVTKWCSGFEKLREHVKPFTTKWAAEITTLKEEDIVAAARMYATTKPGSVYVRLGASAQQVSSTQTSKSVQNLVALCGNIDVPGGNLLYSRTFQDALFFHNYDIMFGVRGPAELEEKRIGAKEYPLMHRNNICDVPGVVRAIEKGKIKAVWCIADNLIVAEMGMRKIWNLLKDKLDFLFVSEFFMTPTAELADIVLPSSFYTEIDEIVAAFVYPSNYVTAERPLVEPPGECKDDRWVALEIAKKMGADVTPWNTVEDYLDWRLKYQGITFDELCKMPDARLTYPRLFKRYEKSTPPFNTASGKFELYSLVFESIGVDPLPFYEEPPEGPVTTPEFFKEFPFLYTHYRTPSFMHSEGRQIKRQRQLVPNPVLEINSERAAALGIKDGDWVYLETPKSQGKWRLKYKARLVPDMYPDLVAGPHGWWFPEQPGPEHGCFDSNINALVTLDPPYDPVVGNVQARSILCRIGKLTQ